MTRKPPAELHPSKQKLVQGVLKISLEGGGESEREAAAVAAGVGRAAAKGRTIVSSSARAAVNASSASAGENSAQMTIGAAAKNALGSNTVNAQGSSADRNGVITVRARETAGGGGGGAKSPLRGDDEAEVESRVAVGDRIKEEEEKWGGVTWDEDEATEAGSLGTVSASLGSMEVASMNDETSQASPITAPEPQDLLIRVVGVDDIREVKSSRICYIRREKKRLSCVLSPYHSRRRESQNCCRIFSTVFPFP